MNDHGHPGTVLFDGQLSANTLTEVRHDLSAWARDVRLDGDTAAAITLCGYEALTNTVEHAYREEGHGQVELRAVRMDQIVTITVTDRGRWRSPARNKGKRGHGLNLMRRLGNHTAVDGTPAGTVVRMTWLLGG